MRRGASLFVVALALAGCRVDTIGASVGDYALYRTTRVGKTIETRLDAAEEYLAKYPAGVYRADVKRFHERAEPEYFAAKEKTNAGLEAYLAALPRGPHRSAAEQALASRRAHDRAERADRETLAARAGASIDRETRGRARVRTELRAWLDRFLDARVFNAPLADASPDLLAEWSLALPAPRCRLSEGAAGALYACSKLVETPFDVVVNGAREAREATIEITLVYRGDGAPVSAEIRGPDLFLRLSEAHAAKAIEGDADARIDSIAGAVSLVREAASARLGDLGACARQPVAPIVLDLGCGGLRVRVTAGGGAGDDVIAIAPAR